MKIQKTLAAVCAFLGILSTTSCSKSNVRLFETQERTEQTEESEDITETTDASSGEQDRDSSAEDINSTAESGAEKNDTSEKSAQENDSPKAPEEEPVVFTEEDISFIHKCFMLNEPQQGRNETRFITPNRTFDFSEQPQDLDSIMSLTVKWYGYVFSDVQPDDQEQIEDGLRGMVDYQYFKPETVEKAIREKILPDFDISGYELTNDTLFWNSEKKMFDSAYSFFPDGYSTPTYLIMNEGQEGSYYNITVLDIDYNDLSYPIDPYKLFLDFKRQKYTFRKLPNGNIAPLKMTLVEPEAKEYSATVIARQISEICEGIKQDKDHIYGMHNVYIHDMDKDGKLDLVTSGIPSYGQSFQMTEIFSAFSKDNRELYEGNLYPTKSGDWVVSSSVFKGTTYVETETFGNGDKYYWSSNAALEEPIEYCEINGAKVSYEEYKKAVEDAGILINESYPFDYDISSYFENNPSYDKYEFILFCRDNLF